MSRLSKEELARFSGAEWMLRLVEEKGLEEARKEFEKRNLRGIPLQCRKEDVLRLYESERDNLTKCMLIIAISTLHDEYGFGSERLKRYADRFNLKASCLAEDYVNWKDIQAEIAEETGIYVPLPEDKKGC